LADFNTIQHNFWQLGSGLFWGHPVHPALMCGRNFGVCYWLEVFSVRQLSEVIKPLNDADGARRLF